MKIPSLAAAAAAIAMLGACSGAPLGPVSAPPSFELSNDGTTTTTEPTTTESTTTTCTTTSTTSTTSTTTTTTSTQLSASGTYAVAYGTVFIVGCTAP